MSANTIETFNTEPLMNEINDIIKRGLKTLLKDYNDRYELLEKTHKKIMNLPSVKLELNNESDSESDNDNSSNEEDNKTMFISIKDMTHDLVKEEIGFVENKLEKLEKRYDSILPILDNILSKIQTLGDEVKAMKPQVVIKENIKLEIEEKSVQEEEESEEEEVAEVEIVEVKIKEEPVEVKIKEEPVEVKVEVKEDEEVLLEEEEEEVLVEQEEEALVEEPVLDNCEVETEASEEKELEEEEKELEEEEEELMEIEIDDITYATNNDENGFIYEMTEDGDVGNKVGYFKDGEPFFYADEQ